MTNPTTQEERCPEEATPSKYVVFEKELCSLINKLSMENGSDTPDFMLAGYLTSCLIAFDMNVKRRTAWYAPPIPADTPPMDPR